MPRNGESRPIPRRPATDELLMITPERLAIMCGITRRATIQAPFKLMSSIASQASSVSSCASPYAQIPALLNRMSIRPNRSAADGDGRTDRYVIPDVGRERQTLDPERAARGSQRIELGTRPQPVAGIFERPRDVERDDVHSFARQRQRRRLPLAVGCTCDHGHMPREVA